MVGSPPHGPAYCSPAVSPVSTRTSRTSSAHPASPGHPFSARRFPGPHFIASRFPGPHPHTHHRHHRRIPLPRAAPSARAAFPGRTSAHPASPGRPFSAPRFPGPHLSAPRFPGPHLSAPHFLGPHLSAPRFLGPHLSASHFLGPYKRRIVLNTKAQRGFPHSAFPVATRMHTILRQIARDGARAVVPVAVLSAEVRSSVF